jgi:two-component system, chemotaxis family, chemotaxis protein CheY
MQTILVVDDSEAVRQQLRIVLEQAGYSVLDAYNGAQALTVLETYRVALIISDINMPRMNGLELLEELKLRGRSLPFLVLTIEHHAELLDRARRAGAIGWIIKPFKPALLIKAIATLLGP